MSRLAQCGRCRHAFEVPAAQVGALVPCPACGKVVDVGGLRDPLWLALRVFMLLLAVALGIAVGSWHGPGYGLLTGAAAVFALWLLSRAL